MLRWRRALTGFAGRAAVGCMVVCSALIACGPEDDTRSAKPQPTPSLPFSLHQVSDTQVLGRPAVYDRHDVVVKGQPVVMRHLTVAYRVTSQDPVGVLREWVGQLAALRLGKVTVQRGETPGRWLGASVFGPHESGQPANGWGEATLWNTEDGPILLVNVAERTEAGSSATASTPPPVPDASPPPAATAYTRSRRGLFVEQGQEMHMPADTRKLMPSLPTPSGTGGSTSILAARDAKAALGALLEEARSLSASGESRGPEQTRQGDVEITQVFFVIPAGGWAFHAVAVQGPADKEATIYVTSSAD